MQIHQLQRSNPNKRSKRIGRGGLRGKTSGRGHKGQHQHGGHGIRPEIRDQIKKLPKLRGRGKNSNVSRHPDNVVINLAQIEKTFEAGATVSPLTLKEQGLIKGAQARNASVKILGNGELSKKISVEGCLVSQTAQAKISKAGGTVA